MGKPNYEQVGVAMTCRSYEEYFRMFQISDAVLEQGPILDIAAGGSSFTAEARGRGYDAYAIDPRYDNDVHKLIAEASEEINTSTAKIANLQETFDWTYYGSIDNHKRGRINSLQKFSEHVRQEGADQYYIGGKLPELPFEDETFSTIICSHFMFLYAEQFGLEFHLQSIKEMLRICKPNGEIHIYPLFSLRFEPYVHLEKIIEAVQADGGIVELKESNLTFIPGSNRYLHIRKNS